jgi:hypothetical protein
LGFFFNRALILLNTTKKKKRIQADLKLWLEEFVATALAKKKSQGKKEKTKRAYLTKTQLLVFQYSEISIFFSISVIPTLIISIVNSKYPFTYKLQNRERDGHDDM